MFGKFGVFLPNIGKSSRRAVFEFCQSLAKFHEICQPLAKRNPAAEWRLARGRGKRARCEVKAVPGERPQKQTPKEQTRTQTTPEQSILLSASRRWNRIVENS
jgi:hypothetical protein